MPVSEDPWRVGKDSQPIDKTFLPVGSGLLLSAKRQLPLDKAKLFADKGSLPVGNYIIAGTKTELTETIIQLSWANDHCSGANGQLPLTKT